MAISTWTNNGTYWSNRKLSAEMRMQADSFFVYRQFVDLTDGLGASAGEYVDFSKQLLIDSRGGTLSESATMPTNEIKFVQDSLQVTERGNAVKYTQKATTLSKFDLRDKFQKGLVMDQTDVIDRAVATEFQSAKFVAVCTTTASTVITSDGTATATAGADLSDGNVRDIVTDMKIKKIPKVGRHYLAIVSPQAAKGLYGTLQAIAQYADPNYRFQDELGRYFGVRFTEDNSVLDNTSGASSNGEALFFGAEGVMEAVGLAEEIRYEETDMGRSKKLGWYNIAGWKKMWDLTNDDTNSVGTGLERIYYVKSA